MSEVGNQFVSQSLADLLSASIATVGGRVFPDANASQDLIALNQVVNAWRSTHAQTYGNALPDSGTAYAANPSDLGTPTDIIAPSNNEVVFVNGLSVENAGSSNIEFQIVLGDTVIAVDTVTPGTIQSYPAESKGLLVSKGQTLSVIGTGGTPTDIIVNASGVKTCI